jgi:hypothetical protein
MDRIERIGPRPTQWLHPAIDPDREETADRRRRERQRRIPKNAEGSGPSPEVGRPPHDGDPPHHIDIRA